MFSSAPIKRRLVGIILLTSGAVLLLTLATFSTYEFLTFRQSTAVNLSVMAEIVASNSTAALAFSDEAAASEILGALKANPHIVAAGLYDENGKLFSKYPETINVQSLPLTPEGDGSRFEQGSLITFKPVMMNQKRLGTLYLQSDLKLMWARFRLYGLVALLVIGASFVLAYTLSRGLQRQISLPILALTKTAKAIAEDRDYSVRAEKLAEGEFGLLTDAFNNMLTEIHNGTRALGESEERFRSAMHNSAIGMALVSPDGRWLNVNNALCKMLGYSSSELLTKDLQAVINADDLVHELGERGRLLNKEIEAYRLEARCFHKSGAVVWVDMSVSLVCEEDGPPLYLIAQIQDISDRKRDEELLRKLNTELERRVEERTAKLNEANKELESFSYSVSHDLRAPLRAIDGFSRILVEEHEKNLNADGLRVLQVIRTNTQKMGRLIDDMLAFSRLGRKSIDRRPIDFDELVREVRTEIDTPANVEVKVDSLPPSSGDRALIRQVVTNLLSNAAKYSRKNGSPKVEVGGYSENGENIYFVKDNGVGFDMAYSNKLFGVFQRLHGPEEFEGTGVGLAIVQRIIQRHGGRVWANGKVNEGATFYFTLPKEHSKNVELTQP
jgi:PAS domain S-box-containing protein